MIEVKLTLQDAMKQASAAVVRRHYNQAEQLCRAILGVAPDQFDALHLLAAVPTNRGQHAEALVNYARQIRIARVCRRGRSWGVARENKVAANGLSRG